MKHERHYQPGDDGLVFVASTGAPLKRGTFRARIWKPSLQRAGLSATLRFYDLRHSYATWLVSDGVPINDGAKVMGHERTSTALDRYTHSTKDRDKRVRDAFAAFSLPPEPEDESEDDEGPSLEGPRAVSIDGGRYWDRTSGLFGVNE